AGDGDGAAATEGGDGGGDSGAGGGETRAPSAELRLLGERIVRHGYFCRLFTPRGAIEGREETEVDPFDGGGRGAIDVSGAAQFRNPSDKPERNILRADGEAHNGSAARAGKKFSGFGAWTGPRAMGSVGELGQAAALDGAEWESFADCRVRIDRQGSSEAGEGV